MYGKCVDFRLFSDTTSCAKKLYVCSTGRFKVKTFLLGAVAHVRSLCSTSLKKIDSQQIFTAHCHILQIRNFFLTLSPTLGSYE